MNEQEKKAGAGWSSSKIIALIGALSAVITIFCFMTGIADFKTLLNKFCNMQIIIVTQSEGTTNDDGESDKGSNPSEEDTTEAEKDTAEAEKDTTEAEKDTTEAKKDTTEAEKESADSSYILPQSTSRLLNSSDIAGLSLREINYAKNEIYARHGRAFESLELKNYFNSKSWYVENVRPDSFSESLLSEVEKKNAEFLSKTEHGISPGGYQLDAMQ